MYENKIRLLIMLLVFAIVVFIALALSGCAEHLMPQPGCHPTLGTYLMFVPEGTKIGDTPAPEDGLYISERLLIDSMKREAEEKREREQRERRSKT